MAENPTPNGPVESKVTVASLTSFIVTSIMGAVLLYWPSLPDTVSNPLAAGIAGVVTGALTFGLAWLAKHTNRTDPAAKMAPTKR